jgi:septal ring-binding cell division protein DamX
LYIINLPTEIAQQTETIKQNEQTKTAQQTEPTEPTEPTEIAQQTETIKQNEQTEITQQIKKDNSVNYRVQICALKKQVNINYFVNNHQIKEPIYANMHQGWHKYTVGKFMIYKGARNYREIIKDQHKIEGPFVTAYNNGTRITVQEALMISKDQWVQ